METILLAMICGAAMEAQARGHLRGMSAFMWTNALTHRLYGLDMWRCA